MASAYSVLVLQVVQYCTLHDGERRVHRIYAHERRQICRAKTDTLAIPSTFLPVAGGD